MQRFSRCFMTLVLLLFFPLVSLGWSKPGHMLVAQIAYDNLTDAARSEVDKLVGYMAAENTKYNQYTSFAAIAHWPDDLRSERVDVYSNWHFIDTPFTDDGTVLPTYLNPENIAWAIPKVKKIVANEHANHNVRARFLAFLAHFVGDIHQPLHVSNRFSNAHPQGDRGGNLYPIEFTYKSGHKVSNLHSLWDNALTLYVEKGFSSYPTDPQDIGALAKVIMTDYPESYFGGLITKDNPQDWAAEGFTIAKTKAYLTAKEKTPEASYLTANSQIVEQRLALGGYRLASLLNQIFTEKQE